MNNIDFDSIVGIDTNTDTASEKHVYELLEDSDTCVHQFTNLHTEYRKFLVKEPDELLKYAKEQLEGKNTKGNYIVEITNVKKQPFDLIHLGYGISYANMTVILSFKKRLLFDEMLITVKASADSTEKIKMFEDEIPIYGDSNKDIAGFMTMKTCNSDTTRLVNIISDSYTAKGLPFPGSVLAYENRAGDKNIYVSLEPLLPKDPATLMLTDDPVPASWAKLKEKIYSVCPTKEDFPTELRSILSIFKVYDPVEIGLTKGSVFHYDKIGASFNLVSGNVNATGVTWDTLMNGIFHSYISIYNLWNHYKNVNLKTDLYLSEFLKIKSKNELFK